MNMVFTYMYTGNILEYERLGQIWRTQVCILMLITFQPLINTGVCVSQILSQKYIGTPNFPPPE